MLNFKEKKILERVSGDKPFAEMFFSEAKHVKWFYPLKRLGYLSPDAIKCDKNGAAAYWQSLDYIRRVSQQLQKKPEYEMELINIICEVTNYAHDKSINNPYIWRSLMLILGNISNHIIKSKLPVNGRGGFNTLLKACATVDAISDLTISEIGKNLLPKFLSDDSMIEYAEAVIDVITDIKPSEKKRSASALGRDEAVLKWEPYWILEAFKKNGDLLGKKSNKAVFLISKKLKRAFEYNQSSSATNVVIGNDVYEFWVSRIDESGFRRSDIKFKNNVYSFEIKQYTAKQLEGIDINHAVWSLINVNPELSLVTPITITATSRDLFVEEIKSHLPNHIDWISAEGLNNKLTYLYDGLCEDHSQLWFKSLSRGGNRGHANDADEVLALVLRDLLLARSSVVANKCKDIINSFLTDEFRFPFFKRIVLLFIDRYWDNEFCNLFDEFLAKIPNVLREDAYEVELHDILRNHHTKFSQQLNAKLEGLINDIPDYYREQGDKYINLWKYKWLSPLKDSTYFKDAYSDARVKAKIEDTEEYRPERDPYQSGFISHKSHLSKEELLKKHEDEELVEEFNKYGKKDLWAALKGEPDREGLAETFKLAVTENPNVFSDKIDQYKNAPPYFVFRLFWGFTEAVKAKKELDWDNIIDFCLTYIPDNKDFLSDEAENEDGDKVSDEYLWSIGFVADLIEEGSNDDAIKKDCFDKVSSLFNAISLIVSGEKSPDTQRDAITYALNSTMGKIVRSNIIFGLRVARETKKKEMSWGNEKYERYFGKGIESYIWFGRYFPQIRYLDREYSENKLTELAKRNADDYEWQSFMEGYLTGTSVYDDIYFLTSMRAHYEKAIDSNVFDKKEDTSLVHHITIAYLRGNEALAENNGNGIPSLFWKLLNNPDTPEQKKRWLDVASYFWSISPRTLRSDIKNIDEEEESLNEAVVNRILAFWKWTYDERDRIKQLLGDAYNNFLGALADLTIYLVKIDDANEQWLMLSAPHSELHHMSSFFVEYLTGLVDDEDSMKRMGKIFLKMLEGATPTFREDDIHLIIERLYQLKSSYPALKEDADKICNTYGERGYHFLKKLYFSNQT